MCVTVENSGLSWPATDDASSTETACPAIAITLSRSIFPAIPELPTKTNSHLGIHHSAISRQSCSGIPCRLAPFGNQAAATDTIGNGPWLCAPAFRPVCLCRGTEAEGFGQRFKDLLPQSCHPRKQLFRAIRGNRSLGCQRRACQSTSRRRSRSFAGEGARHVGACPHGRRPGRG